MTIEPILETNADLPEHRVAVVVFTTVRAVDKSDAVSLAESAVRKAIRDAPGEYDLPHAKSIIFEKVGRDIHWRVPVVVRSVLEVGQAARNGYLGLETTSLAYRGDER